MFHWLKTKKKHSCEKDNLGKKGRCFICEVQKRTSNSDEFGACSSSLDIEKENMFNLFGVEVCEGCYHDILNHMSYRNIDDLLDCDKKQLMLFLNKLAILKSNN